MKYSLPFLIALAATQLATGQEIGVRGSVDERDEILEQHRQLTSKGTKGPSTKGSSSKGSSGKGSNSKGASSKGKGKGENMNIIKSEEALGLIIHSLS